MKHSALEQLRSATRDDHDRLDRIFSRYDLSDRAQYGNFLKAHAMALLPIEDTLGRVPHLPAWRPRGDALCSDLRSLRLPLPSRLSIAAPANHPQALGMLYVAEGSRLGGAVLSAAVDPSFPSAFLNSRHQTGEWRALLDLLRQDGAGDAWKADAVRGAQAVFRAYLEAAERVGSRRDID